jgi:hypothetical protein
MLRGAIEGGAGGGQRGKDGGIWVALDSIVRLHLWQAAGVCKDYQ